MRITQLLVLAGVIGFLACSQVGCASAQAPGDEKTSVFQGTQTIMTADPVTVTTAAKEVVDELKLTLVSSGASGLDGKVVARTANERKLTIDVKTAGENLSRVTVRAGGFGDKTIQKQVLDRMRAKLPATAEADANANANAAAPHNQPTAKVTVTYPDGKTTTTQSAPRRVTQAQAPKAAAPAPQPPAPAPAPEAQSDTAQLPF